MSKDAGKRPAYMGAGGQRDLNPNHRDEMEMQNVIGLSCVCLALGCNSASGGAAPSASMNPAQTTAVVKAAGEPTKEPSGSAPEVTCKALIAHVVEVQEAEKKEGMISRSNADKMDARCQKANNMKDNSDVVKCIMAAKDVKSLGACPNIGKLFGPW